MHFSCLSTSAAAKLGHMTKVSH